MIKHVLLCCFVLLLAPILRGGAPAFLSEVDTGPLRSLAVKQGGRLVPLPLYAEAFVHDVHGGSAIRVEGNKIEPLSVLLECMLAPERAMEWVSVPAPGRPEQTILAVEAMLELASRPLGGRADVAALESDAALEARLSLMVFASEEVRLIPSQADSAGWRVFDEVTDPDLARSWDRLGAAWRAGDAPTVHEAIRDLAEALRPRQLNAGLSPLRIRLEILLDRAHLLSIAVALYFAAVVVLVCVPATRWPRVILVLAWAVHLVALVARAIVMDRIPVHNHYESMVTVAAMLAGVTLTLGCRAHGATVLRAGAALTAVLLAIAEWLDVPGQILELEAGILSSTAILKYHVLTILGAYAMIMLGAGIGGAVLVKAARREPLEEISGLHRLQVSLGFIVFWVLGLGILLGAVWADRAWGRWWAFDPKETWALITWLLYLAMVHIPASQLAARRRPVVIAILHLLGLLAMLWTYFGVNLLLPSLHSYA
jgi:ABC-type transport system involved in cytochrome c biogenesis permease subunit